MRYKGKGEHSVNELEQIVDELKNELSLCKQIKPNLGGNTNVSSKQFYLDKDEEKKLTEWQDKIKDIFGEYGLYDYIFTPTGIGDGIRVRSHLSKTELDLTDVDKW